MTCSAIRSNFHDAATKIDNQIDSELYVRVSFYQTGHKTGFRNATLFQNCVLMKPTCQLFIFRDCNYLNVKIISIFKDNVYFLFKS